MVHSYVIIFGAAVNPNGEPSGALKRRLDSALAMKRPSTFFIVSGGIGKNKTVSEAEVMKSMLSNSGIKEENILMDEESIDTLASVVNCTAILKARKDYREVIICTDRYHIPRCRWLFLLFSISTKYQPVLSGLQANGIARWVYYYLREAAAIPYDTVLTYFHKWGILKIKCSVNLNTL